MIQSLSKLISEGESKTLEFKTTFDNASIASLVAFSNIQGGMVLVGASDGQKSKAWLSLGVLPKLVVPIRWQTNLRRPGRATTNENHDRRPRL